jgi:aryl-alcohol dehydrogenase-like predicted oxidoreductase
MEDLEDYRPDDHGATPAQIAAAWAVAAGLAVAALIL